MSFARDWLDLREPADHAARDRTLLAAAAACVSNLSRPVVVDLGAGTGSTVRAFEGRLPVGTRWRLIDNDAALVAAAAARTARAEAVVADLADLDALPVADAGLVTASALFDLVSRDWVDRFAASMSAHRLPVYAALTFDGEIAWSPVHPLDAAVRSAIARHQRGEKGLGQALGPDAAAALAEAFVRHGYDVRTAPSPWRLGPADAALVARYEDGIAAAAAETGLATAEWRQARRAANGASSAMLTVGHVDVLAIPR